MLNFHIWNRKFPLFNLTTPSYGLTMYVCILSFSKCNTNLYFVHHQILLCTLVARTITRTYGNYRPMTTSCWRHDDIGGGRWCRGRTWSWDSFYCRPQDHSGCIQIDAGLENGTLGCWTAGHYSYRNRNVELWCRCRTWKKKERKK